MTPVDFAALIASLATVLGVSVPGIRGLLSEKEKFDAKLISLRTAAIDARYSVLPRAIAAGLGIDKLAEVLMRVDTHIQTMVQQKTAFDRFVEHGAISCDALRCYTSQHVQTSDDLGLELHRETKKLQQCTVMLRFRRIAP